MDSRSPIIIVSHLKHGNQHAAPIATSHPFTSRIASVSATLSLVHAVSDDVCTVCRALIACMSVAMRASVALSFSSAASRATIASFVRKSGGGRGGGGCGAPFCRREGFGWSFVGGHFDPRGTRGGRGPGGRPARSKSARCPSSPVRIRRGGGGGGGRGVRGFFRAVLAAAFEILQWHTP
jgi:hypothetical protein